MTYTTQGKCSDCKIRWIWNGKPLVREARCPECGESLERTSHHLKYRIRNLHTLEAFTEHRGELKRVPEYSANALAAAATVKR